VVRVVTNVDTDKADSFVSADVAEEVDLVSTDESGVYHRISNKRPRQWVTDGRGEYVRGNVHTCTIDGFWSLLKRGIIGTFHNVSRKYLPVDVAEFEWRHNNRDDPEIFSDAIALC
jgi:hypothetical protein